MLRRRRSSRYISIISDARNSGNNIHDTKSSGQTNKSKSNMTMESLKSTGLSGSKFGSNNVDQMPRKTYRFN